MDFAVWQELAVAGCIFALQTEDAAKSVFETRAGRKALSRAVKYECHEILAVPQVQAYLECRWVGVQTKSELEELKKPLVIFENFWLLGVKVLCLPLVAIYPALAEQEMCRGLLVYTPRLRLFLYNVSMVIYFSLLVMSDLVMYRSNALFARDWARADADLEL